MPTDKGSSNRKAMCPCVNVSSERRSLKMPCCGLAKLAHFLCFLDCGGIWKKFANILDSSIGRLQLQGPPTMPNLLKIIEAQWRITKSAVVWLWNHHMSFRFQTPEKMSYSYLFKYIIIGDTGAKMVGIWIIFFPFQELGSPAYSCNSQTNGSSR